MHSVQMPYSGVGKVIGWVTIINSPSADTIAVDGIFPPEAAKFAFEDVWHYRNAQSVWLSEQYR